MRFLLLLCHFFLLTLLSAQQRTYVFEKKDLWDGLTDDNITAFCEDVDGSIWVGTSRGVCKFDGYNIVPAFLTNGNTFHAEIVCMIRDKSGKIWCGTKNSGLYYKESGRNSFTVPLLDTISHSLLTKSQIFNIVEDKWGNIWCGTIGSGLLVYNPNAGLLIQFGGGSTRYPYREKAIPGVYFDKTDDSIWAVTEGNYLLHFSDPKDLTSYTSIAMPAFSSSKYNDEGGDVLRDARGRIWILQARSRLMFWNPQTTEWKIFPYINAQEFPYSPLIGEMIYHESAGEIVLTSKKQGISFYNIYTDKYYLINNSSSYVSGFNVEDPLAIFYSNTNDFYAGGFKDGVIVDFVRPITSRSAPLSPLFEDGTGKKVLSTLQLDQDNLLVGTDGKGLLSYNITTNKYSRIPIKNANGELIEVVKTIYKTNDGNIWLGHWQDGMTCWNRTNNTFVNYISSDHGPYQLVNKYKNVWGFCEDFHGGLWVAFLNSTVVHYTQNGQNRTVYSGNNGIEGLENDAILDIMCDRSENIWIVSEHNGVFVKFQGETQFRHFNAVAGDSCSLSSNLTHFVFEDFRGGIWIGTAQDGLNYFNFQEKCFKKISISDGLLSDQILSIQAGEDGSLWVVSSIGFTHMEYNAKTGNYHPTQKYIPPFKNKYFHLACAVGHTGKVLFAGGYDGMTIVEINRSADLSTIQPLVNISAVKIEGASYRTMDSLLYLLNTSGGIQLTEQNASFSIDLSTTYLASGALNEFAYTLNGIEKNWHFLRNAERSITYVSLPEGEYILRIKVKSINSDWSPEKVIRIKVTAHFFKSKFFLYFILVIAGILISVSGYLAYKQFESQRKKKKLEQEKALLTIDNEKLSNEVGGQMAELMAKSAEIAMHKELLSDVKTKLNQLYSGKEVDRGHNLRSLVNSLERNLENDEAWDVFRIYFDQTNQDFSDKLHTKFPLLTPNDVRHCILIRLNLGSHEIAKLFNITLAGVQKNRFRLKKKLGLSKDDNLIEFINRF